jgi:hypothetical protein
MLVGPDNVGGPFGTSPTASKTEPAVSKTGFQKRFCAFVELNQRYPSTLKRSAEATTA